MTFWGAIGCTLLGAAIASAVWAFLYGRVLSRLATARLDLRRLEDLFTTRLEALIKAGRLPPPSKADADALLRESEAALHVPTPSSERLSDEDEQAADDEGLKTS